MFKYLFLIFISLSAQANNPEYEKIRDTIFWLDLYKNDYSTLYCGVKKKAGIRVSVEHVYPKSWIAKGLGCKSTKECKNEKFSDAISDLHNIYPAVKKYKLTRRDLPFGEIVGDISKFPEINCSFEITTGKDGVFEPRDEIKGQVARSVLYMIHWYNLPTYDLLPLMIKWHKKYPPTKKEITRQLLIESKQGRRNSFIKEY